MSSTSNKASTHIWVTLFSILLCFVSLCSSHNFVDVCFVCLWFNIALSPIYLNKEWGPCHKKCGSCLYVKGKQTHMGQTQTGNSDFVTWHGYCGPSIDNIGPLT